MGIMPPGYHMPMGMPQPIPPMYAGGIGGVPVYHHPPYGQHMPMPNIGLVPNPSQMPMYPTTMSHHAGSVGMMPGGGID
jgi:hypothetical protein